MFTCSVKNSFCLTDNKLQFSCFRLVKLTNPFSPFVKSQNERISSKLYEFIKLAVIIKSRQYHPKLQRHHNHLKLFWFYQMFLTKIELEFVKIFNFVLEVVHLPSSCNLDIFMFFLGCDGLEVGL